MRLNIFFHSVVALAGVVAASAAPSLANAADASGEVRGGEIRDGPTCAFHDVVFDANFQGGRLSACIETGPRAYTLVVRPEDAWINPSAWYAFRLAATEPGPVALTLRYVHGRHRYAPKLSRDGVTWAQIDVNGDAAAGQARFTVVADEEPLWIAAQPLSLAADIDSWLDGYADRRGFRVDTVGASEEGRPIRALRTTGRRRDVLFIVGRQHPPETTGAVALRAFVDAVLADDPLARRFRRRFAVHVIPLMNPDGVARGQWRHNSRGVDLNRDWGPFTQVETRVAADALDAAVRGDPSRLALFLDFHSTWRNVFYTQPDAAPGRRMDFPADWIGAIDARLDGEGPDRSAGHNPGLPTAKSWVYATYAAPAITFELGDATPLDRVETIAIVAAGEAMRLLLEDGASP